MTENPIEERKLANIERLLASIHEANQPAAREWQLIKHAQGIRTGTRVHYARTLQRFDAFLNGRKWAEAIPKDITAFLSGMRLQEYAHDTIEYTLTYLKAFLTWVHGVERLPGPWLLAFKTKRNHEAVEPPVLPDEEFHKFLAAMPTLMDQAFLAVIWESGFRIAECISLNVGSAQFDDKNGAWLHLPKDGYELKTGPRKVYLALHAGLLHSWLQIHPRRDDPDAPLWIGYANRNKGRRIYKVHVQNVWERAERLAEVSHIWPHRLRHTAATRDTEAGATEADLRAKFGWKPGSKTPARYIHQRQSHLERMARRSVGLGPDGLPVHRPQSPASPDTDVKRQLRAMLRDLLAEEET